MFRLTIILALMVFFSLFHAKMVTVRKTHNPGKCSKSNHGDVILVKDRESRDTMLMCTEDNGVYSWRKTDNSKPPGEYFDPGYDCLDILNKNAKAKDGFYWVNFHRGKPIKVYCDMTTDGGGYLLIGRMNNTVTWNVPSTKKTVKPFGSPRWSSELGDVSVLDFRIQISSDDNFQNTKAHWAYRFKNKRQLKNLMIVNQGGCPSNFPGIGDISYVKDLLTEEIVSRDFSCSKFGLHSHPRAKIGWTMMNLCLERPCKSGFAYHPLYPIQVDYSGGFSFVGATSSSKSKNGETAFFGCDKGKCCACYGPSGGRDIYCLKKCQPTNGGTIIKQASAWFWVRLNPPHKVWEKCMEFKSEEVNGGSSWYKLVGDSNVPVKGRCGKGEPHVNDGVVVLDDNKALMNIPTVTGLLAFRKDNQSLHIRRNNTWNTVALEEKVNKQMADIHNKLNSLFLDGQSCEAIAKESRRRLSPGIYLIGARKVYCEFPSGWTLVARFSNNDGKNWIQNADFWFDRTSSYGATVNPSTNQDMIAEAFWLTTANEIKITRSDDPTHTALLETTNNCLRGKTFRQFITSFGNFRNRNVWSSDKCLSNCKIKYGGKYKSTGGFQQHSCSSNIQSSNYIGFWCDWSNGDGAVMMIGGGGSSCGRADHGIGITEENAAKFGASFGHDFGNEYSRFQKSYALNLWVK